MKVKTLLILGAMVVGTIACQSKPKELMETSNKAPKQPTKKVTKTDEEWKKLLSPEQYRIARLSGTEAPNGAVYKQFKNQGEGTYYCIGCGAELFSSKQKFDSGCGWPSFYDPSKAKNVNTKMDTSGGTVRTEITCAKCGAHLRHVFEGEGFNTPTDKRYCVNGIVLKFVSKNK